MQMNYAGQTFSIAVTSEELAGLMSAAEADLRDWRRVQVVGSGRGAFLFGGGIPVGFIPGGQDDSDALRSVRGD